MMKVYQKAREISIYGLQLFNDENDKSAENIQYDLIFKLDKLTDILLSYDQSSDKEINRLFDFIWNNLLIDIMVKNKDLFSIVSTAM